jgi:hypothetical protein
MDRDKSAVTFSPRKGTVTHRCSNPGAKEAWLVELSSPPLLLLPLPRKLHRIVLQYYDTDTHSLYLTFQSGVSYADVLRTKERGQLEGGSLMQQDLSRIGSALVYPYPKPEDRKLNIVRKNRTAGSP